MAAAGLAHIGDDELFSGGSDQPHLNHELLMNDYASAPASSEESFVHQQQQSIVTAGSSVIMRPAKFHPEYKH
jgi:hypothetical protein